MRYNESLLVRIQYRLFACFAALLLLAIATAAKCAQYEPNESRTHYLAKSVKINTASVAGGDYLTPPALPVAIARRVVVARVVLPLQAPSRREVPSTPFSSRPPPIAAHL